MSRPRHTRRDKNQLSMVTILRSLGMVVWDLADTVWLEENTDGST